MPRARKSAPAPVDPALPVADADAVVEAEDEPEVVPAPKGKAKPPSIAGALRALIARCEDEGAHRSIPDHLKEALRFADAAEKPAG